MKKIPCLFVRDFTDRRHPVITEVVTPGCEWVIAGEGIATRKWDGAACAIIGGKLYARYDAKNGKAPPEGAIPCDDPDPVTGHWPHWIPATRPEDRWIREAVCQRGGPDGLASALPDGTYEALGPKINGNHERFIVQHHLIRHGEEGDRFQTIGREGVPRTFQGLRDYLQVNVIEGIVFHHPDSRMAKIRRDDFGFDWPPQDSGRAT
jgi:hypothetical protein